MALVMKAPMTDSSTVSNGSLLTEEDEKIVNEWIQSYAESNSLFSNTSILNPFSNEGFHFDCDKNIFSNLSQRPFLFHPNNLFEFAHCYENSGFHLDRLSSSRNHAPSRLVPRRVLNENVVGSSFDSIPLFYHHSNAFHSNSSFDTSQKIETNERQQQQQQEEQTILSAPCEASISATNRVLVGEQDAQFYSPGFVMEDNRKRKVFRVNIRKVRQVRPKVIESKGSIQCIGINRKKGIQCRNAALMEYIGPRPLYCAEHIELDPNSLYAKCASPYYREVDDRKGCKEIVLKEFGFCYKHYTDRVNRFILEHNSEMIIAHRTRIYDLLPQLEKEALEAKRKDCDLYQRKNKLIPKFQRMKTIIEKAYESIFNDWKLLESNFNSITIPSFRLSDLRSLNRMIPDTMHHHSQCKNSTESTERNSSDICQEILKGTDQPVILLQGDSCPALESSFPIGKHQEKEEIKAEEEKEEIVVDFETYVYADSPNSSSPNETKCSVSSRSDSHSSSFE